MDVKAVRPNFFIVGAPKSGTTAIYRYLRDHPSVFMPLRKEPHYFAGDLYAPRYVRSEDEYLKLFESAGSLEMVGEASAYYLYSRVAADRIRSFNPEAKIIIMLRNPVDMIYSLHSQRLYSGYEDIKVFEDALAAEEDRKKGRRIPPHGHPIPCLFYTDVGRLGEQVERYLKAFPRDQIHFIRFEDLHEDTPLAYEQVCTFLGIRSDYEPEWIVHNPNKRIRSSRLRTIMKFTPWIGASVRNILPFSIRRPLKNAIVKANTKHEARQTLSDRTRKRLQAEFESDVDRLGRILGLDFGYWFSERDPSMTAAVKSSPRGKKEDFSSPYRLHPGGRG